MILYGMIIRYLILYVWYDNTPVSSYDVVTSLCSYSSVSEARKVFVYVNGGTDAAQDAQ